MSFRRSAATLVAAAAVAVSPLLSSCGAGDPFEDIPVFELDTPRVKVSNPGDGQKVQLAYAITDAPQEITVAVSHGVDQAAVASDKVEPAAPAGGDVGQVTLPLTVEGTHATVGEPRHFDLERGHEAQSAQGFEMRWESEPDGRVTGVQLLPPADSSEDGRAIVEKALLQMLGAHPVFPAEPVGEGAVWTVTARTLGHTTLMRTTTYTLDSIDGNTVTLSVDVSDSPISEELEMEDGEKLTVEGTSTTAEGTITVDLTRPLPTTGQSAATTRFIYGGPNPDFKVVQDVTTATTYGK